VERYQVMEYPHIGIIDPRTGRLLWKKEGWTQENPMTADSFAEIAMDFCSRNSFDRPPQAPRPPGAPAVVRPAKRMHEMSEDEQLQAAMQASMSDASGGAASAIDVEDEIVYVDDDSESDTEDAAVIDRKPQAAVARTLNEELLVLALPEEPAKDGSRIQLRLPDGKRVVRTFAASDPVRAIYAFVAVSDLDARNMHGSAVHPASSQYLTFQYTAKQ
jgi:UBX domain-containing protein 7